MFVEIVKSKIEGMGTFLLILVIIVALFWGILQIIAISGNNNKDREYQRRENLRRNKTINQLTSPNKDSRNETVNNRSTFTTDKVLSENLENKTKFNNHLPKQINYCDKFSDYKKINVAIKGITFRSYSEIQRAKNLYIGEEVSLKRDYNNQYDKNATEVRTSDNFFIGYVDADYAQSVAMRIGEECDIRCFISKITVDDIPFIYMDIFYNETFDKKPSLIIETRTSTPIKKTVSVQTKTENKIKYSDLEIDLDKILDIKGLRREPIIEDADIKVEQLKEHFKKLDFNKLLRATHDLRDYYSKPVRLVNMEITAYEGDNDFDLWDEYECEDGGSEETGYSYHLETKEDRSYRKALKLEDSMEIQKAIETYVKIINSKDIYPKLFCNSVWRLSVILGKMRKYIYDVEILDYAINRLGISEYKQSEIVFFEERLSKSKNKKSK